MKKFLVKCEADYADEFDVYGFKILSEEDWTKLQENIKFCKYPIEIYFGTNEAIVFESSRDIMHSFTVKEMTQEEVEVFEKFFGASYKKTIEYGASGVIDSIIDHAAVAYN